MVDLGKNGLCLYKYCVHIIWEVRYAEWFMRNRRHARRHRCEASKMASLSVVSDISIKGTSYSLLAALVRSGLRLVRFIHITFGRAHTCRAPCFCPGLS